MLEMASHIGAYATLLICERFGGRDIYIPADAAKCPFLALIGEEKANCISWVYRRETITVPTARYALSRARRGGVLAAARARKITVAQAARMLGLRRDYVSKLLNKGDEGIGVIRHIAHVREADPRQIDMFAQETQHS